MVDSSLFHSLPVAQRGDYLRCVFGASRPGARLYVSVFDEAAPFPRAVRPNAVSEEELRAAVGEVWRVEGVRPATIRARVPAAAQHALRIDSDGFAAYPSFLLTARKDA